MSGVFVTGIQIAIQYFQVRKSVYNDWYHAQPGVSLEMLLERNELFIRCDFAIKELENAQAIIENFKIRQFKEIMEKRHSSCFRDCKDLCNENVSPDGSCVIAVAETAKALAPLFYPEDFSKKSGS